MQKPNIQTGINDGRERIIIFLVKKIAFTQVNLEFGAVVERSNTAIKWAEGKKKTTVQNGNLHKQTIEAPQINYSILHVFGLD